jgi:uncharacterized protein YaaW (UPF0174 family)
MRKRDKSKFRHVKTNKRAKIKIAPRSNSVDMIDLASYRKMRLKNQRKRERQSSANSSFKMNVSQSNYSLHYDEDLTNEFRVDPTKKSGKRQQRKRKKQNSSSKKNRANR